MQITPSLPIRALGPNDPTLELRPAQRVTASILQVSGVQAVLSIGGYPIVAEISSSELAASLKGRSLAQFIVSQAEDGRIVLRLAAQTAPPVEGGSANSQNLALKLLDAFQLAPSAANQTVAQAIINQRLDVQPGQIEQLLQALASLEIWGANEANLGAAMLAAGLPLTGETLALAVRPDGQSGQSLMGVIAQLNMALQDTSLPAQFKEQLQNIYNLLQAAILDPRTPAGLNEKIAEAIRLLGQPLENQLAQDGHLTAGKNLASMAQLPQEAARFGKTELAHQAETFWKDLSQAQFFNVADTSLGKGEGWLEAALLMHLPTPDQGQATTPVRLRIARQDGKPGKRIDPDQAHMIIQVDLPGEQVIQVEINLNQNQVKAGVTLPDASFYEAAQKELPGLQERLADRGYALGETHLEIGEPRLFEKLPVLPARRVVLTGVNLEA